MREKLEYEQYFFDQPTLDHLAGFVSGFTNPCCLCTPSLGQELERRGIVVTTLDIDARFATLRGFRQYNLDTPERLDERFGLILCDPPFLGTPLAQLFQAIKLLSHDDYSQPIVVNYLSSRAPVITAAFAPFGLRPTGYRPGYATIQNIGRNQMELFSNLGPEHPIKPPPVVI